MYLVISGTIGAAQVWHADAELSKVEILRRDIADADIIRIQEYCRCRYDPDADILQIDTHSRCTNFVDAQIL